MHIASILLPLQHRHLIWQLARREVLGRYRGSMMGVAWSVITPLLMLGVYTFVFVGVFRARWPGMEQVGGVGFALQIFAGLLVFNLFAEFTNRAPRLIVDQPNLVKKVVFPLEILPWISLLGALFHLLLSLLILLLAARLFLGHLPVTAIAAPVILLAMVPLLLGIGWFLGALGVFMRDVAQVIGPVVTAFMFLSPVFYSLQALPEALQVAMQFNPLTLIIEELRGVVIDGRWPRWHLLALYFVTASGLAVLGLWFFRLTRKGFADVL